MRLTKNKISRREIISARLLNYSLDQVLNSSINMGGSKGEINVAAQLKMAVNQFIAAGMNNSGTAVDYQLIAKSSAYRQFREHYTPQLCHFDPNNLATREDRLAFWINLYNVLVIDAVIRFNVEKSVAEGFAGILKFFRRAAYRIHGERVSLEDIEHGILRGNRGNPYIPGPQFGKDDHRKTWIIVPVEPRIHFAINCASRSCPPIGIYTPEAINVQLDMAARNFVKQETQFDTLTRTLTTSNIFNWFKNDFGGKRGVIDFIRLHLPEQQSNDLSVKFNKIILKFHPYDWNLNI